MAFWEEPALISILWAIAFVMVWSLLYRENFAFRVAEHITIGFFLGFTIYTGIDQIYKRVIQAPGNYADGYITAGALLSVLCASVLGVMMWLRLYEPTQWIARWPIAVLTGVGAAISIRGAIEASLVKQLVMPSWAPSWKAADVIAIWVFRIPKTTINSIIIAVGTFTTISYFIFTKKQEGPLYISALLGRITMMVTFGVTLGVFLASNINMAVGQMTTLMAWPGILISIIACALVAYDIYVGKWPGPFAPKEE